MALSSQDRLERAAQRFVPKHKTAAQRLVRQHALTAEQKLVGEAAAGAGLQEWGTSRAGADGGRTRQ
jgi:hypothetical protein